MESVVAQDFADWELIIVEDGSADQAEILRTLDELNNPRVRAIALSEHHNAAYARNVGIDASRGDWIAFLDSDDYFLPNKLSTVFRLIEAGDLGEHSLVYSQFIQKIGESEHVQPTAGIASEEKVGDYLFVSGQAIGTPGIVMSRRFAAKVRFDPLCIKHQDYDLLLRAEQAGAHFLFIETALWVRDFRASHSHVGAQRIPHFSCGWLNDRREMMSDAAQLGFLYSAVLAPMASQSRLATVKDLLKTLRCGNWPKKHGYLLITPLLPFRLYDRIRAHLHIRYR